MTLQRIGRSLSLLLLSLGWLCPKAALAQDVVVVLSSESGPYQEALAGFRESFGPSAQTFILSKGDPDIPKSTRLIVAIGGKAAVYPYEAGDIPLIYCLAPGVYVDPKRHPGSLIKVYMSPPPHVLLQELKELQPGIRRLGVLWVGESAVSYGGALKKEGGRMLVSVLSERLESLDELPDHLRTLKGRVEAIWIPPDPLLITPQSFSVMRQFALDNNIPLYVSIDGLADKGAAASVSVSFREMGRKAGILARETLAGSGDKPTSAYGDVISLMINATSALQSGLSIPSAVLKKANRVIS